MISMKKATKCLKVLAVELSNNELAIMLPYLAEAYVIFQKQLQTNIDKSNDEHKAYKEYSVRDKL